MHPALWLQSLARGPISAQKATFQIARAQRSDANTTTPTAWLAAGVVWRRGALTRVSACLSVQAAAFADEFVQRHYVCFG